MSNSSHYSSEMLLTEPVLPSAHLHNNGNVNSDDNTSEKQSWIGDQRKTVYEGNNHNTINDDTYVNNSVAFDSDGYSDVTISNLGKQPGNENDTSCCDINASDKSVLNISDSLNEICEAQNTNLIIARGEENSQDDNQCLHEANEIPNSTLYDYTSDEGLFEYEEGDSCSSSTDMSPQDERVLDASDSDDSFNSHRPHPLPRGIHNPNYPGFQHLAYTLQEYSVVSPLYFENGYVLPNKYIKSEDAKHDEEFCESEDIKGSYFIEEHETNNNDSSFENACNINDKVNRTPNNSNKRYNINYIEPTYNTPPIDIKYNGAIIVPNSIRDKNNEKNSINNINEKNINGNISTNIYSLNQRVPLNYVNNILDNSIQKYEESDDRCKLNPHGVSDFQEDLIALQREIYEVIQKPLANTLQNISEVVNNVLNCIAEENHDTDSVNWMTALENTETLRKSISFTENFHTEEKACKADVKIEPKVCTYQASQASEESIKSIEDISCKIVEQPKIRPIVEIIKSNMDDAYMSNAREELLESEAEILETENRRKSSNQKHTPITEIAQINGNNHDFKDFSQHDSNCNKTSTIKSKSPTENENCNTEGRSVKKSSVRVGRHIKKLNENQVKKTISHGKGNYGTKETPTTSGESSVGFDVYNIETAMPVIDLDAIENHLRAAREEERRRRNDREEIRRRLALGAEVEDFYGSGDRPGRKPSLQARLQSGMNLQICFMNDTASDGESPTELELIEDLSIEKNRSTISVDKTRDSSPDKIKSGGNAEKSSNENTKTSKPTGLLRPSSLALSDTARPAIINNLSTQADFFACQARLQTEARMALAQAKEMARIQMEIDRQRLENSPITEMLRVSLEKAGIEFFGDRRRVSRQMLTDMNIAQLQVIVNELHTQIEFLNESLVKLLIARDELHMGQDSMLVDIEDLTRHLGAKELTFKCGELNDELPSPMESKKIHNTQPRLPSLTSLLTK